MPVKLPYKQMIPEQPILESPSARISGQTTLKYHHPSSNLLCSQTAIDSKPQNSAQIGTVSDLNHNSCSSEGDPKALDDSNYNSDAAQVIPLSTNGRPMQRVKKDALWKPLLRGFRIYLRRTLEIFLDINQIYDGSGDLSARA